MSKIKDSDVLDAETKLELVAMKEDLHSAISEAMREGFKTVNENMSNLYGKDIQHLQEQQQENLKKHEEHYNENGKRRDQIDCLKSEFDKKIYATKDELKDKIADNNEKINLRLNNLSEKISSEVTKQDTKDTVSRDTIEKKGVSYALVGIIVAIFTTISSVITAIVIGG